MVSFRPLADWSLSVADGQPGGPQEQLPDTVPATVPGCVHTDLLAHGLIPDPYLDDNENRLQWIGRTDWVYETTVERPPGHVPCPRAPRRPARTRAPAGSPSG